MEKPNYIMQYSIDVVDNGVTEDMETEIIEALEKAGIIVAGISWKARWTEEGYDKGEHPIDWD